MITTANTSREHSYLYDDNKNDNTSDDSLLLMADNGEEKAPLLSINDDDQLVTETVLSNDIPLRPQSPSVHCHVPDDKFDYAARNRLIVVLILCIIFMTIEIVGGILSNSTAVVTDAAHMGIDVASFFISLTAMYLGMKRPTRRLSFGYSRAEVLGALLSVLTIWLATGVLVYMAIERCINRNFEVKTTEMIIVASCGVVFNIVMFFVLHANMCGKGMSHHGHSHGGNHGHSHGNGHSHRHTSTDTLVNAEPLNVDVISEQEQNLSRSSSSSQNINVRAAIIHVIGDFVQSIGVLVAAIVIKFKPEYKLADPICTFTFSVLVLFTTITIMRDIVLILMEAVPVHVNYARIVDDLHRLPGVRNAHSLHIWSLSMQKSALSVHIAIDAGRDYLTVLGQAQELLRRDHSIARTTIQVEPYDEYVMNSCENCRRPDI